MSIQIETFKSEYDRAAENDVFRTGVAAYKQKLTPDTGSKCVHLVLPY